MIRIVQKMLLAFSLLIISEQLVSQEIKKNKLDSLFNTLYKEGNFNGCVLIAESGKPIYEKALGYANMDTRQPLTNNTVFELASISKPFTAMAIMQLKQQGKLNYDDTLQLYFPKFPYKGITVKNLLQHSSGLPEFLGWDETYVGEKKINDNQDVLEALITHPELPHFKAGEQISYINTNYVLLALIVEKASGLPFAEYLEKNIFKPSGMVATKVYAPSAGKNIVKDYALGYNYDARRQRFVTSDSLSSNKYVQYFGGVSGPYGISSNVEDLFKWDRLFYTEQLIRKQTQEEGYKGAILNDGTAGECMGLSYGFGWFIIEPGYETGKAYMHTGGYSGYSNIIIRYPEKDKTIILLSNKCLVNIYELAENIENILFDRGFFIPQAPPMPRSVLLNPVEIKVIEGTYAFKEASQVKITISSALNIVYAQITGQKKVEIYSESPTDFFYTAVAARIKFLKDEGGVVRKLVLYQNGKEIEATKEH